VRWWDRSARRRRALWHVVVDVGDPGDAAGADGDHGDEVACLVAIEGGRASLEAVYD
jgi:hypothetical protein